MGRRRRSLLSAAGLIAAASLAAWHAAPALAPSAPIAAGARRLLTAAPGPRRPPLVARHAEGEPVQNSALLALEKDIEAELMNAQEAQDQSRITRLARLMVMAKASEGAAAWQATEDLRQTIDENVAATLRDFVGKDDYDLADVTDAIDTRLGEAVQSLDNVYLTAEAAANAPPGSNPVVLSEVMAPVVEDMKVGAEEAVLAFTGKEEYEFGDISKEAAMRANKAIASVLGKEEYKFGDISKAAAGKVMDALTGFTGKEEYQFGDVTKTVLRNALNFLEGDKK